MNAQDIIDALSDQRNAALNEIAMLRAQVAQLQRELASREAPVGHPGVPV